MTCDVQMYDTNSDINKLLPSEEAKATEIKTLKKQNYCLNFPHLFRRLLIQCLLLKLKMICNKVKTATLVSRGISKILLTFSTLKN